MIITKLFGISIVALIVTFIAFVFFAAWYIFDEGK